LTWRPSHGRCCISRQFGHPSTQVVPSSIVAPDNRGSWKPSAPNALAADSSGGVTRGVHFTWLKPQYRPHQKRYRQCWHRRPRSSLARLKTNRRLYLAPRGRPTQSPVQGLRVAQHPALPPARDQRPGSALVVPKTPAMSLGLGPGRRRRCILVVSINCPGARASQHPRSERAGSAPGLHEARSA